MAERLITSLEVLGATIRSKRKRSRLSQGDLGRSIGVHQTTLSAIENGSSRVRLDTLLRVLSALDYELILRDKKTIPPESGGHW